MYTTEQTQHAQEIIISGIANGKSLLRILKKNKEIPRRDKIYEWLNPNHPKFDVIFSDNYARAREDGADVHFEEVDEIIRLVGKEKLNPQQGRVMIQGKQWIAGRMKPKKYGAKIDVTTAGKELQNQIVTFYIPDNGRQNIIDLDADYNPDDNQTDDEMEKDG